MVTIGHFNYHHQNFSWGNRGQGQDHRGSCLSAPIWRRPCRKSLHISVFALLYYISHCASPTYLD